MNNIFLQSRWYQDWMHDWKSDVSYWGQRDRHVSHIYDLDGPQIHSLWKNSLCGIYYKQSQVKLFDLNPGDKIEDRVVLHGLKGNVGDFGQKLRICKNCRRIWENRYDERRG